MRTKELSGVFKIMGYVAVNPDGSEHWAGLISEKKSEVEAALAEELQVCIEKVRRMGFSIVPVYRQLIIKPEA